MECPAELLQLPSQVAALSEKIKAVDELKLAVNKVLESCQKTEVHLAKVPTFQDLSPLKVRVTSLEESRTRAKGIWVGLTLAAGGIGGILGHLSNFFSGWFNPH